MKKIFLLILLYACLNFKSNAQFNKQWLVSGGFQLDKYNFSSKNLPVSTGSGTSKYSVTNYAVGVEVGRYFYKNISLSYKLVYQNWDAIPQKTISILNGIMVEKLIPIHENISLNVGLTPFYEFISDKKNYNKEVSETYNWGSILSLGFSFIIDNNIVLGTHLFRKFNSFPDQINGFSSLSGYCVTVKYVIKKSN